MLEERVTCDQAIFFNFFGGGRIFFPAQKKKKNRLIAG